MSPLVLMLPHSWWELIIRSAASCGARKIMPLPLPLPIHVHVVSATEVTQIEIVRSSCCWMLLLLSVNPFLRVCVLRRRRESRNVNRRNDFARSLSLSLARGQSSTGLEQWETGCVACEQIFSTISKMLDVQSHNITKCSQVVPEK